MKKKIGALLALFWVVCIGTAWGDVAWDFTSMEAITLSAGDYRSISSTSGSSTLYYYFSSGTSEKIQKKNNEMVFTTGGSAPTSNSKYTGRIFYIDLSTTGKLTIICQSGKTTTFKYYLGDSNNALTNIATSNFNDMTYTSTSYKNEVTITDISTNKRLYFVAPSQVYIKSISFTEDDTPSSHTVTYNANGDGEGNATGTTGSVPEDINSPYTSGATVTVLGNTGSLAKTGYSFSGWNTAADGNGTSYTAENTFEISENTTLYAKWTAKTYTITLDGNEGAGNTESVTATYNSPTLSSSITNPTRSGYAFQGWYSGEGGTEDLIINTSGELQANTDYTGAGGIWANDGAVTLYAKWIQTFTVAYLKGDEGASGSMTDDDSPYLEGTDVTVLTNSFTAPTGKKFKHWSCSNENNYNAADVISSISANLTLTAVWEDIYYTISYEGNGATSGTMEDDEVIYNGNKEISTNGFTKTGNTFTGWNADVDVTIGEETVTAGTLIAGGATLKNILSDIILTAQWSANSYTLAWNKNAEDADDLTGSYTSGTVAYGTTLTAPNTPTRDGYRFMGWATSESGDVVTVSTMPAANTTYYAQWEENSEYYKPSSTSEIIILNNAYNQTASTTGYSNHAAISWEGTTSSNSKTAGDPNNGGAATSSNQPCYSIKGNGKGKNITLKIRGCAKITLYHESHASRYPQLKVTPDGESLYTINGRTGVYYNEFIIDNTKSYSIFLHGTTGSDDQDLYIYAIKLEKSISSVPVSIGSYKWGTFCAYYPLNFEDSGVSAYIVTGHSNETLTRSDALSTVPANTPLLVKAEEAGTYNIPVITSSDTDVDGNNLKAGTGRNVTAVEGKTTYVLSVVDSKAAFKVIDNVAAFVPVNKAYLQFGEEISLAPSFLRIEDSENNTTNVETIGQEENVVKFFENGVLYIKRDGIVYDVTGRIICK